MRYRRRPVTNDEALEVRGNVKHLKTVLQEREAEIAQLEKRIEFLREWTWDEAERIRMLEAFTEEYHGVALHVGKNLCACGNPELGGVSALGYEHSRTVRIYTNAHTKHQTVESKHHAYCMTLYWRDLRGGTQEKTLMLNAQNFEEVVEQGRLWVVFGTHALRRHKNREFMMADDPYALLVAKEALCQ